MRKIGLLTTLLIGSLVITGCDNSLNEEIISNDKTEANVILNFELLTGSWKDIDQMDKEREKWYDNTEVQELSTNYFNSKSITFNQISKALEDTSYRIEYNKEYGDEELLIVEPTWWYPNWKLYNGDKLIGEGDNIGYFEKQGKHFILCYNGKDGHSCIIDGEVNTSPYIIDMQWALPKIYNGDIYSIKWLGDGELHKFGVYKNNEELYTFEAEHPTDTTVQSLVVDGSGWWVFYRTRNVGEEGIFFHLIHNGEDLGEINGWEDIIGLNNYGGKAFYMYKKDGVIYYNLNGEDHKTEYEDIIHDLCCSPGMYNISFRNSTFTFYGKKDGEYSLIKGEFIEQEDENISDFLIFSGEVIDVINKNSVPVEIISLGKEDNQYIYVLKVYFKDIFQSVNFKFTTNSEIQNGEFELKDSGRRLLLKNGGLSISVRNNEISVENPFSTYIQCYERIKDSGISFPMFSGDIVKEGYEKDGEYFPTVTYSTVNNASAFYKVNPYPFVMEPIKTWENNCVVELNRKETLSEGAISPFVFGEGFEKALYLTPKDKTLESDCKGASRFIGSLPKAKSFIVEASKLACHIYYQDSLNNNFPEIKEISIELHGIQHNPEEGTITLDNGEELITIMDKNLGATTAGTGEESFGYYFQRGNNYGFSKEKGIKTGNVKVKAEEALKYGPNNPYKNDVMYVWLSGYDQMVNYHNYDYMEINNDNLWGGSGDDKLRPEEVEKYGAPRDYFGEYSLEDYVGDTGNPREERQGPCPEGFHVPSYLEWKKLISIRKSIEYPKELESDGVYLGRKLRDDLLLPWAGGLRFNSDVTLHDRGSVGYYRSSSPSWFTQTSTNSAITSSRSYRSAVFSVRCFKN